MPSEPLIDQDELAERLGCSPRSVERYRVTGEGPAFCKIGRLVRYRAADVDAWLAGRVRRSTSEADAK